MNLSQRLLHPATVDSVVVHAAAASCNPATFAGYFATDEFEILSASPERFLQVRDSVVEARPIKGTRARVLMPEADLYAAEELRQSEKDRAENVMIVDLLRNDLSPICEPESVFVKDLCRLEVYQFVQHLVSVVEGRMRPDKNAIRFDPAGIPYMVLLRVPRRCGRWKSFRNWNQPLEGLIVVVWDMLDSMGAWI